MLIAVKKNKFIVLFIIYFSAHFRSLLEEEVRLPAIVVLLYPVHTARLDTTKLFCFASAGDSERSTTICNDVAELSVGGWQPNGEAVVTHSQRLVSSVRYDTRCCFNVRSKADMSQLNLPHGTNN